MTRLFAVITIVLITAAPAAAQNSTPPPTPLPVPKPFPGAVEKPAETKPTGQPERRGAATVEPVVPAVQPGTAPIHPSAELLDTFDAGQGQRYLVYGTDLPYATVVEYYKQLLRTGGNEIFRAPAMHRFDMGRFDENTMAYPPGIVIKDYTWNGSAGYLNPKRNAQPARFPTIIQIVPAPADATR